MKEQDEKKLAEEYGLKMFTAILNWSSKKLCNKALNDELIAIGQSFIKDIRTLDQHLSQNMP